VDGAPTDLPRVAGVRHRFVDAGGLRMHVAEAGPEDGEPLVLLHGWPQHWYEWRGLVPELSQHYRMLMPDLRGLGWTDVSRDGYEKENLARDVVNLLDALELERVKLVGHDWGGYAGFLLCLLEPERVERYMALNIIHPWPSRSPERFVHVWRMAYQLPMLAPLAGPRVTRTRWWIPLVLRRGAQGALSEAEVEAFAAPLRDRERATVSAAYYRTFQLHDLPLLARGHWRRYRLRTPTLMLFGTGDFAIHPSFVSGYEPYADDMSVEFVEGTGHFIADVAPELVAQRTLEFMGAR
jgi:pimeloyl-ACP methyl ester carboxylesterase